MAIDITKGIEPFEDRIDFTRGNKDRQTYGKSTGTNQFHLGNEYDVQLPETPPVPPVVPPVETPAQKFTHKLANGTTLEAATVEELATLIEKSLVQQAPPAPVYFEDKPLYTPMEFKRKELTIKEKADILNLWAQDPQAAKRQLDEAEYGQPMEVILQQLSRSEQRELNRRQEEAGVEFVMEMDSYNPTRENAKKLTDLLHSKGKPITKHNLVVAFQQLSAADKSLVRKVDDVPEVPDPSLSDSPPIPTIVPSNTGRPDSAPPGQVDAAKFAAMPLDKQKQFFKDLRRG